MIQYVALDVTHCSVKYYIKGIIMLKKLIPVIILGLTAIIAVFSIIFAATLSSSANRLENALDSYANYASEYITDGIYAFAKSYSTSGSTGTQLTVHNKDYSKEYDFQAGYTPLGSYFSAVTPDFQGKIIRSGPDVHIFTNSLESYVSILDETRIDVDRDALKKEVSRIVKEKLINVIKSSDIKNERYVASAISERYEENVQVESSAAYKFEKNETQINGDILSLSIKKEQVESFINEFKNSEIINNSIPAVINFKGLCDKLLTYAADIEYSAKISNGVITEHTISTGENTIVLSIFGKNIDVTINGELFKGQLVHWEKGGVPLPAIPPDNIKHDWSYENGFTW